MDNMSDDTGNIALGQCIFFGLVIVPAIFCLFKHGIKGLPGWIYVIIFCVMRVTGGAILLNSVTQNLGVTPAGLIVSSVAIAPLVMAVAGVAHETYYSIETFQPFAFGWIPYLFVHLIIVAAIAPLVVGYMDDENLSDTIDLALKTQKGLDTIRGGGFALIIAWLLIMSIFAFSYKYPRLHTGEKLLADAVSVSLFCLFIRIVYLLLGALVNSTSYNPWGATLPIRVVLDVLPECLLIGSLLVAGMATIELSKERGRYMDSGFAMTESHLNYHFEGNEENSTPYLSLEWCFQWWA